jgi:hypothetical protein
MSPTSNLSRIAEDERLTVLAETDQLVVVRCQQDGGLVRYVALARPALDRVPWEQLEGALLGRRELKIMSHLSRIVGYFSQTANWNRSKIEELHDRQKGSYGVTAESLRSRPTKVASAGIRPCCSTPAAEGTDRGAQSSPQPISTE